MVAMAKKKGDLSGKQKSAILLIFLGQEISSKVFKEFSDDEMEILTLEIAKMQSVDQAVRDGVLEEFGELIEAFEHITQGGLSFANDILERALGREKAVEMIGKLSASFQVKPFDVVRTMEPDQVFNFIQSEHPQTIALILAHLSPNQASQILPALPIGIQADVARRIAQMERISPEIVREVEKVLEKKLSSVIGEEYTTTGGVDNIVDILNMVDRSTEKTILETLEIQDPELAEEIKNRMLVFEDVILLDNKGVQRIVREIDMKDLSIALKGSTEEVKEKFYGNMSKRAAKMLQEEMEFMGPVRMREVEESQAKIVGIIRQLEEQGDIVISRGDGEDEMIY